MGPIDFVIIGVVLVIVALAAWYVIRAKKRGAKCIGCPSGDCCCSKSCKGNEKGTEETCSCGCCGGVSAENGGGKPEA